MERFLIKERSAIYVLCICIICLFLPGQIFGASVKRKVLPTVDYPQYITQEVLASHPKEFEGIYARINHYVVEKSDLMDQIFNIIDTTDIRIIFKNPSYKEGNLYMYISDSELYVGEYVFSPHLRDTNIDEISNHGTLH